jgi:DNA-binding GntR family transcriptional regulator
MNEIINFESRIPYYIQLMDILKEKVQLGNWAPGDQIPGEQDLCELYGDGRCDQPPEGKGNLHFST